MSEIGPGTLQLRLTTEDNILKQKKKEQGRRHVYTLDDDKNHEEDEDEKHEEEKHEEEKQEEEKPKSKRRNRKSYPPGDFLNTSRGRSKKGKGRIPEKDLEIAKVCL